MDPEIYKFESKDMTDLKLYNLLKVTETTKNDEARYLSKFSAIKTDIEQDPNESFSPLLEMEKEHNNSCIETSVVENACSFSIKKELDMDFYEIGNVSLKIAEYEYASEGIKQEINKLIVQPKKEVIEDKTNLINNLDYIPCEPYMIESRKLVVHADNKLEIFKKDETCIIGNLHHGSELNLNNFKGYNSTQNNALVKVEINDYEEVQEIAYKDYKIKSEELDIKEDFIESGISISSDCVGQEIHSKCENYPPEGNDQFADQTSLNSNLRKEMSKNDRGSHKKAQKNRLTGRFRPKYLDKRKVDLFKCNKCEYETIHDQNLKKHMLRCGNTKTIVPIVSVLKCDQCSYKTIVKSSLKQHSLRHRNAEDVQMFKCGKCDFQTIWKQGLMRHLLRHNKLQKIHRFKCDQCSYQTMFQSGLNRHLLRHRIPEDAEMFKCNNCEYVTIHKQNMKKHLLRYENTKPVSVFKCDYCPYKTMFESGINRHLLRHRNPEEAKMFKCNKCNFQTIWKQGLKVHMLRHNNSEKIQKFKCDQCSYKTIYRSNFKIHVLRHKDPDEVNMFKCNECDFQTIHKKSLKVHMLRHNNSEEIQNFKCDQCSYKTNFKSLFNRHIVRHRLPDEDNLFKCNKCHFQTKHKTSLKRHQLLHNNTEEVQKFTCYKCDFQTRHKTSLKRHRLQHDNSEVEDVKI